MSDGDPDRGQTVELASAGPAERSPERREQLRDHLPGLEPERHITDWGRSERVEGIVDRTLYEFLYHYWFRVEVEGIDNVPDEGGALLLANHAGVLPPDSAMVAKALRAEHPRARPLHVLTDQRISNLPGLGMLAAKVGAVPDHPANLSRLLFDEDQLVLAFPEGSEATSKAIRERYRLRQFERRDLFEIALKAEVPIVPVAIVGAEEAVPQLARLPRLGPLRRVPMLGFVSGLSLTPAVPLPAKFRIRFLEPVKADEATVEARSLSHDVRALIQENLLEMVAQRRNAWLG
jgi:1-acyl-sn-glycerol-3-phosphate acyltransferase